MGVGTRSYVKWQKESSYLQIFFAVLRFAIIKEIASGRYQINAKTPEPKVGGIWTTLVAKGLPEDLGMWELFPIIFLQTTITTSL